MKHQGIVRQAVFSPDGHLLLTASEDGTARLREVTTGKDVCPPMQHGKPVRHAAFNPEGSRVVTACDDGAARIWDSATGRLAMPPLAHSNAVLRAEFSPDGRLIVTASLDNTARLWNAVTGEPTSPPWIHPRPVYVAAFSPDGRRVVTVCRSRLAIDLERTRSFAQVWDVATGQRLGSPLSHDHLVYHADFSPDGQRVVTAGFDGTAIVWDAQTGRQLASSFRYGRDVKQSRFSPDGRRVATGTSEGVVQIWDATTGEAITPQLEHPALHDLMHLRFSADGQRLLVASGAQTASLRRLPKTDLPVEDLLLQAQLLSGYKIEAVAGVVPLPPMELSNAWHTLRTRYPTMFSQEQPMAAIRR
jgi:WD40 repeat protein